SYQDYPLFSNVSFLFCGEARAVVVNDPREVLVSKPCNCHEAVQKPGVYKLITMRFLPGCGGTKSEDTAWADILIVIMDVCKRVMQHVVLYLPVECVCAKKVE